MQNQQTNRIDPLQEVSEERFKKEVKELKEKVATLEDFHPNLLDVKGNPISKHEIIFKIDELVEIKGYTYRVKYIGETSILFEPVGPLNVLSKRSENDST